MIPCIVLFNCDNLIVSISMLLIRFLRLVHLLVLVLHILLKLLSMLVLVLLVMIDELMPMGSII